MGVERKWIGHCPIYFYTSLNFFLFQLQAAKKMFVKMLNWTIQLFSKSELLKLLEDP